MTVLACTHESGCEPPWLRDARSNLLCSVLMRLSALHITDFNTGLHGLLDRRLFNWINNGDGRIEAVRFPKLFSSGEGLYDGGYDAERQRGLQDFLRVSGPVPDAYSKWLSEQAQAVDAEKQRRITDIANVQVFRIGMCVRAVGLQKAKQLNGQLGVITSIRDGDRRGVIFERYGVRAVKIQNIRPVALTCVTVGSGSSTIVPSATARSAGGEDLPMTADFRAAIAWAEKGGFVRPDILARVKFVKAPVSMSSPPCGDIMVPESSRNKHLRLIARMRPPCVGCGTVDLTSMKGWSCREWLLSGICEPCQRAFLA